MNYNFLSSISSDTDLAEYEKYLINDSLNLKSSQSEISKPNSIYNLLSQKVGSIVKLDCGLGLSTVKYIGVLKSVQKDFIVINSQVSSSQIIIPFKNIIGLHLINNNRNCKK